MNKSLNVLGKWPSLIIRKISCYLPWPEWKRISAIIPGFNALSDLEAIEMASHYYQEKNRELKIQRYSIKQATYCVKSTYYTRPTYRCIDCKSSFRDLQEACLHGSLNDIQQDYISCGRKLDNDQMGECPRCHEDELTLESHRNKCPIRLQSCPYCEQEVLKACLSLHIQRCYRMRVTCSLCQTFTGPRHVVMKKHREQCPNRHALNTRNAMRIYRNRHWKSLHRKWAEAGENDIVQMERQLQARFLARSEGTASYSYWDRVLRVFPGRYWNHPLISPELFVVPGNGYEYQIKKGYEYQIKKGCDDKSRCIHQ